MRKTIFTLGLMLAAALSLTNCTKNEEATFTPEVKVPFELYANMDDTRTTNDGIHTNWAADDAINVFHAVADTEDYVNDTPYVDGAGTPFVTDGTGKFKGTLAKKLEAGTSYDWYAFYPYSSYVKTPASTSSGYMPIGCKSNEVQTQDGNNNTDHIAGPNYPLVGVKKNVPASEKPAITMSHASSLVEFVVKNGTGEAFVVESIAFTAPEDIVGTYYINFASEPVAYTKSGDSYVANKAVLTVDGGTDVPADGAYFYMGIKPFTAAASSELTVNIETDKGTFEKSITLANETTFSAGLIKTITVNVNELVVPDEPEGETIEFVFADEGLSNGTSYTTFTKNDIDVIFGAGTNTSNDPKYYDGGTAMRMYKQNTLTISGAIITNISMTLSQDYDNLGLVEGQSGSLAYNSKVYTWSGNDTSVEFYNKSKASENNQVRIQKIAITYIPADPVAACAAPEITCADNLVTITAEDGATIYYTIDGTEPSISSPAYSAPFEITKDCVVKAFAIADGKAKSVVSEKTCVYADPNAEEPTTITYDFAFTSIGSTGWTNSYAKRTVDLGAATVIFEAASKQTTTITDCPVTKGQPVTLTMKDSKTISGVTFVCKKWSSKTQTITLHYSTDGGSTFTSTNITSTTFTISSTTLPVGTNAVKITFNSSKNQIGIASATVTLAE